MTRQVAVESTACKIDLGCIEAMEGLDLERARSSDCDLDTAQTEDKQRSTTGRVSDCLLNLVPYPSSTPMQLCCVFQGSRVFQLPALNQASLKVRHGRLT